VRRRGKTPEESTAQSEDQADDKKLGPANSLRATFAVIPSQDQSNEEANNQRQGYPATDAFRPAELLRDDVDPLKEREGGRDVGNSPLH